MYDYSFIIAKGRDTGERQPKEETHRMKSGMAPNVKFLPLSGPGPLSVPESDNTQRIANQRVSLNLRCPEFY